MSNKWEYKIETVKPGLETEKLKELGLLGWELVNAVGQNHKTSKLYLRRKIESDLLLEDKKDP